MVARSSDSESKPQQGYHYILRMFFSLATLSRKPTSRNFPTRRGLIRIYIASYSDFFKVSPKMNGAEKPKICAIFHAKLQTISAVVR